MGSVSVSLGCKTNLPKFSDQNQLGDSSAALPLVTHAGTVIW